MNQTKARQASAALGAFLLMFAGGLITNCTSYFIGPVTGALSCSRAVFSVYFSLISVCTVLLSPFVSVIIKKIGFHLSVFLGTVGVGAGYLLLSQVTSLWMLYLGGILMGLFQVFIIIPPVSIVNGWFPEKNGFVMGFVMSGNGVSGIVLAQLMPRVIGSISWRAAYVLCAVCWVVCTLLAIALTGLPSTYTAAAAGKRDRDDGYRKTLFSVGFLVILFSLAFKNITSMFTQHFSTHLSEFLSTERVITIMTIHNIVLVTAKMTVGMLYDKLGSRFVFLILLPVGSLGYLGLISQNLTVILVSVTLMAFCFSAETVVYPLFLRQLYGREFASNVWGTCRAISSLGNSIGTPLWGAIYDCTGSYRLGLCFSPIVITVLCVFHNGCLRRAKIKNEA